MFMLMGGFGPRGNRSSGNDGGGSHSEGDSGESSGVNTLVRPEEKTELKKPSMYKVVLLNDDYTPMDFVVTVLKKFFSRSETEATQIMLNVHHQGRGIAGVYAYEIAETKAYQAQNYAKLREFPLKCIIEKE